MTKEIISLALEGEGFKAGAQGFSIPEERQGTVLVGAPGEILTIGRVVLFELREKFVVLQTAKDERIFLSYEDVLGLRVLTKAQASERSAGFGR